PTPSTGPSFMLIYVYERCRTFHPGPRTLPTRSDLPPTGSPARDVGEGNRPSPGQRRVGVPLQGRVLPRGDATLMGTESHRRRPRGGRRLGRLVSSRAGPARLPGGRELGGRRRPLA